MAVQSVKDSGSNAKVVTFDTNADLVKAVEDGDVQWAIDQQPFLQGYEAIDSLWLYLTNRNIVGGGQPVLTGPSFTHRSIFPIVFGFTIRSDTALVDRRLADTPLGDVSAILIGHSHYDHLLDVPYIARSKAPRARVWPSTCRRASAPR